MKETRLLTFKVTFCIHKGITYMVSDRQKLFPSSKYEGGTLLHWQSGLVCVSI